jgi:hypothetical protein
MALFFLVAVAVTLSRHKYPTGRKATTELSAHNKMSVDFSTAELRTILRAHPGRKRDGTVRPRGEQAIRTMMSAITTHYRRVHGESSGSLGDLTWITADSFVQPSQAVNIASVTDLAASGQRRLADNLRSASTTECPKHLRMARRPFSFWEPYLLSAPPVALLCVSRSRQLVPAAASAAAKAWRCAASCLAAKSPGSARTALCRGAPLNIRWRTDRMLLRLLWAAVEHTQVVTLPHPRRLPRPH